MRNSRNARRARWIACGAAAVVLAALVTGSLGAARGRRAGEHEGTDDRGSPTSART